MIVVVLVLIWVIALTPFLLRRLSEHQIASSVSRFRTAIRLMRRVYPRLGTSGQALMAVSTHNGASPQEEALRRRKEAARAKRQIERRKQFLVRLVGGTATSAVFGALPHLHAFWDLSIAGAVLTAGYVGALAVLASHSPVHPIASGPARSLARHADARPVERRLVAAVGGSAFIPQMPRRPSFVVVDPNS